MSPVPITAQDGRPGSGFDAHAVVRSAGCCDDRAVAGRGAHARLDDSPWEEPPLEQTCRGLGACRGTVRLPSPRV